MHHAGAHQGGLLMKRTKLDVYDAYASVDCIITLIKQTIAMVAR